MSAVAVEAARSLRAIAGEEGSVKVRIARAARAAKLSYWRAFDVWYGRARLQAVELELIRQATDRRAQEAAHEVRKASVDLLALAHRLAAIDPDFFSADDEALRDLASRLRGLGD